MKKTLLNVIKCILLLIIVANLRFLNNEHNFLRKNLIAYAGGSRQIIWNLQWNETYEGWGHCPYHEALADLDNDGINEIVIGGLGGFRTLEDSRLRILSFNNLSGRYEEKYSWTENNYAFPGGATTLDLDADGLIELVVSWGSKSDLNNLGVWAYKWNGTKFTAINHYLLKFCCFYDFPLPIFTYACDYDDDGDVEVLVANDPKGGIKHHVIALGWDKALGRFVNESVWSLENSLHMECPMLWGGDVDGDGKMEVVVCVSYFFYETGGVWVLDWDGKEWTSKMVFDGWINGNVKGTAYGIVVGDINGNKIPEIIVGNNACAEEPYEGIIYIFEFNGTVFQKVGEFVWKGEYSILGALAVGDIDSDYLNELVVGGGDIHIIGWNGSRYYEKLVIAETDGLLSSILIGDFDNDGYKELKASSMLIGRPYKYIHREWIFNIERADTVPPITVDDYDNLWHTSDFLIKLNATDDLSGVRETFYRINGGSVKRLSVDGYPYITTEGANNTLEFWSVDNAGNEETHKFLFNIKLDKNPPFGKLLINEGGKFTNSTDVVLKVDYYDNASGVVAVRFSNDGLWDTEQWENVGQSTWGRINRGWSSPPGEGVKTVYCQLRDFVGFFSQTFTSSITLDITAPTTSHDYDGAWRNRDFYINLTASDNFGGTETFYRINSNVVKNVNLDGQPLITTEGWNTLEFWSVDEAGNVEAHNFLSGIKLDKTPPKIVFSLSKKTIEVGQTLMLDASASSDSCAGVSEWLWLFGDGTNATGPIVKHSYSRNGTFTIILRVYDNAGNYAEVTDTITVLPKSFPFVFVVLAICIGLAAAMIGGFIVKRKKRQMEKSLPSRGTEVYSVVKPTPSEAKYETVVKQPSISKKTKIEEIDEAVFNHITSHGGTISLSQAAEELNLTMEELKESIDRLKKKGLIE
ncbi:MAG: FG-GAP-like repeat-containing protein [Candidatus Bathyarchaeia archaeon]